MTVSRIQYSIREVKLNAEDLHAGRKRNRRSNRQCNKECDKQRSVARSPFAAQKNVPGPILWRLVSGGESNSNYGKHCNQQWNLLLVNGVYAGVFGAPFQKANRAVMTMNLIRL